MPESNDHGQQVGDLVPDWHARPFPEPVTLAGRYVRVAPLSSAHYSDLFEAVCGPKDDQFWTYRSIAKPTRLSDLWMHLAALLESTNGLTFALIPTEGPRADRASGFAALQRVDPDTGQVEVANVLFSTSLQRTRAATEAIHLLMRHAFDDLEYRRFEWKCDSHNEPSRRAAARLGFSYEGRFRNHMVTQGRNRDTDWFSVIDSEWPAVRAAHEAWLDPSNFTDDGQQKTPLQVDK